MIASSVSLVTSVIAGFLAADLTCRAPRFRRSLSPSTSTMSRIHASLVPVARPPLDMVERRARLLRTRPPLPLLVTAIVQSSASTGCRSPKDDDKAGKQDSHNSPETSLQATPPPILTVCLPPVNQMQDADKWRATAAPRMCQRPVTAVTTTPAHKPWRPVTFGGPGPVPCWH
ncbi:hypothetical protein IF1G_09882 [Cordyceps javanica]|uniref:Secreted protein n=1 Tax=Cordyceps javanica TaxID=43265 RepID=A0A545UPM5_9HYPO|nr:hypothetical protein IF1G_09882 [Cordyceps javanica]